MEKANINDPLAIIFASSVNQNSEIVTTSEDEILNHYLCRHTLCPNIIVLVVSPRCLGDGPIVTTNDVLAVPMKFNSRMDFIRENKCDMQHS